MKDSFSESISFFRRKSKRYSVRFNQLKKSSSAIISSKKSSLPLLSFNVFDKKSPNGNATTKSYPIGTSKSSSHIYPTKHVTKNLCYESSESSKSSCLPTPSSSNLDLHSLSPSDLISERFEFPVSAPCSLTNGLTVPPLLEEEPFFMSSPRVVCVHEKPANPLALGPPVRPARRKHSVPRPKLEPPPDTTSDCTASDCSGDDRSCTKDDVISQLFSDDESDSSSEEMDESSFERSLEANLELIGKEEEIEDNPVRKFRDVKLRHRNKLQLYIDTDLAKARAQKERGLRRIREEDVESLSSKSTNSTPRSPAIDIDEVFRLRKKNLQDEARNSMILVKDLTEQLQLDTPTKNTFMNCINSLKDQTPPDLEESTDPESSEKPPKSSKMNILQSLDWVKHELIAMRQQDEALARQFIQLRLEMQKMRLVKSCNQHEKLLEEVAYNADHHKDLNSSDFCDFKNDLSVLSQSSRLRQIGLTQMNITRRRFSLR